MFDNTFAQVGAYQAPLYFLSSGQLNIQIPYELTASEQIPILLSVNNALTLPVTLDIVPTAPGVLSAFNGPTPPSLQNDATSSRSTPQLLAGHHQRSRQSRRVSGDVPGGPGRNQSRGCFRRSDSSLAASTSPT